jgi:Leucine-rich repeat (LRR) protein
MKSSLFLCLLLSFNYLHAQSVITQDSAALVNLYNITHGSSWTHHDNWLTAKPVSTWYGVTVAGTRVAGLALSNNNLTGTIPDSLGQLTALQNLDFSKDKLNGPIPSAIGKLQALKTLNLSANLFSSSLPDSIGMLTNLTHLSLRNAKLTGSIPATIGNLVNVAIFDLSRNSFTGSIPTTIGNLINAVTVDLTGNQLSGSIPSTIGNLKKATAITLNANQITGSIPSSIGNLANIYQLDISYNQLTGSIPASVGNATTAQILSFNDNQLTGIIPSSISKIRGLITLDVSTNHLTGTLPPGIFSIPTLEFFEAYLNQLTDGPDLSGLTRSFPALELAIGANRFTFKTLQYAAGHIKDCYYDPQAPIDVHQHGSKLAVSAGGTLSKNTYVWYKTGSATGTTLVGDSTFTPAEAGSYFANIYNSIATGTVLTTDTVSYSTVTAVETIRKISVYPNPAKNIITVQGLNAALKNNITIADVMGNIRLQIVADKQASVQCDISRLQPGNYTLKVSNTNNSTSLLFQKQ